MMCGAGTGRAYALLLLILFPAGAAAQAVVLKKKFIEESRNRVSIQAEFLVDDYSAIHSISDNGKDGDIHVGGRSRQVGLPLVAEIVNARENPQKAPVRRVRAKKGGQVTMTGVWRLWFEHPPKKGEKQIQKLKLSPPADSNPDNVYEIHPVTHVDEFAVLDSFRPIPGFRAYDAEQAFGKYKDLRLTVKANKTTVVLVSTKVGYNYADFIIDLRQKPWPVPGGWMALADILDAEENPVETRGPVRIVFVEGTAPANAVKDKVKGYRLHLLGMPRVNLDKVWAVVPEAAQPKEMWLPYEMIAVAVVTPP